MALKKVHRLLSAKQQVAVLPKRIDLSSRLESTRQKERFKFVYRIVGSGHNVCFEDGGATEIRIEFLSDQPADVNHRVKLDTRDGARPTIEAVGIGGTVEDEGGRSGPIGTATVVCK